MVDRQTHRFQSMACAPHRGKFPTGLHRPAILYKTVYSQQHVIVSYRLQFSTEVVLEYSGKLPGSYVLCEYLVIRGTMGGPLRFPPLLDLLLRSCAPGSAPGFALQCNPRTTHISLSMAKPRARIFQQMFCQNFSHDDAVQTYK